LIPVRIAGVIYDNRYNSPVVLLQDDKNQRVLPIFIGPTEATAIVMVLEHQKFARPLTIDLIKLVLDALKARVVRVNIAELKEDTFIASLVVEQAGRLYSFDARPSDSIGLALRAQAPIFVAEEVMAAAGQTAGQDEETRIKDLQERLRNVNPEDMGDVKL